MNYFRMLLEKEILKEDLENYFVTIIDTYLKYKKYIDNNLKSEIKSEYFSLLDNIYDTIIKYDFMKIAEGILKNESNISDIKFFEILNSKIININFSNNHINFCNKLSNYEKFEKEVTKLIYYYNIIAQKINSAIDEYKNDGGKIELKKFPIKYKSYDMFYDIIGLNR